MALNVSAWSTRNPLPAVVLAIVIILLGWLSFVKLPITRLPNVELPLISVSVVQFGAAPADLESQITKLIEDAVSGVEGVRRIQSSITDGLSVTNVLFRLETDTDRALNDVKDAVTRVRSTLPSGFNEPLIQRAVAGQRGDWTPIGAEHTAGAIVVWRLGREISWCRERNGCSTGRHGQSLTPAQQ